MKVRGTIQRARVSFTVVAICRASSVLGAGAYYAARVVNGERTPKPEVVFGELEVVAQGGEDQ